MDYDYVLTWTICLEVMCWCSAGLGWAGIKYVDRVWARYRCRLCSGYGSGKLCFNVVMGEFTCLLEEGGGKQRRKRDRTGQVDALKDDASARTQHAG
jgi:hypothetical protein